jgi:dihydrofolate reductase
MAEIVVIAAVAAYNRVIGDGLRLPWHIPGDLKRFKRLTTGHPLIMGRRTFESLVQQFGGPLPGRENAILTRSPAAARELPDAGPNVLIFPSLPAALAAYASREMVFIGGGASIYGAALDTRDGGPLADRLELTIVEGEHSGDTFFPPYEHLLETSYRLAFSEAHGPEGTVPGYRFETWVRA